MIRSLLTVRILPVMLSVASLLARTEPTSGAQPDQLFHDKIAPIFERACLSCHNENDRKGGLSLESADGLRKGGESGVVVEPSNPRASLLLDYVSGPKPQMPKEGGPLAEEEVEAIRAWIAAGAGWPDSALLKDHRLADANWWSLRPLIAPDLPKLSAADERWCRTPVDRFIMAKLREKGLSPSPEADRRTLIRRLYFDLLGLPPSPDEIERFVADPDETAYEHLVDRLLASPQYGERWARHWLDAVHYGDTHGFDKDKIRPNAWPYRDYVIRALNDDKPYDRFVEEQLAGDVLFPSTRDGIVALGFIAAGPFDYVGHVEVPESKTEGRNCRMLDRDDIVRTTMETFTSMTVGCARCHNHKFDPITQEDYYSLQAVFAAVDRADRPYDLNSKDARERFALEARQRQLAAAQIELQSKSAAAAGTALAQLDKRLADLARASTVEERPEFGYHSEIEPRPDAVKWVQINLGHEIPISELVYVGCHDTFNNIGDGFGFPVRYKIELSNDPEFKQGVTVAVDHTQADVPNPGVAPQSVSLKETTARYVRFTATRLSLRQNDYIFALAELMVLTPEGKNVALGSAVTALDSIEALPRWARKNLVDGYYYRNGKTNSAEVARLTEERRLLFEQSLDAATRERLTHLELESKQIEAKLQALPPRSLVYAAATDFAPEGSHVPMHGKPREISTLRRGDVQSPIKPVGPGAVACITSLPARFTDAAHASEGERRIALARWITEGKNPLTWRSIVNRIWHYHFGRGLVETLNDFGRMGSRPSHPELLDWLALWFHGEGSQSVKRLHKLIVMSSVYRQTSGPPSNPPSASRAPKLASRAQSLDAGNQFLWRMNRRKLEAEAIRDTVMAVSGQLDRTMGGPGFQVFVLKDDHSPHYLYEQFDPDDPKSHRRSIYRLVVRSVPDPFLEILDCADPSVIVERRNETMTPLQALSLLNNKFMVRMAEHFADRVKASLPADAGWPAKVDAAVRLALGREPTAEERGVLVDLGEKHGFANVCRVIFNASEFVFVD